MKEQMQQMLLEVQSQSFIQNVMACNEKTNRFGIWIAEKDARRLLKQRHEALAASRRIELAPGITGALIIAFCDSPYLNQEEFVETIGELIEMFYYFKNESPEELSDDELLSLMIQLFNGVCYGDLELLNGLLEESLRNVRYGFEDYKYEGIDYHSFYLQKYFDDNQE